MELADKLAPGASLDHVDTAQLVDNPVLTRHTTDLFGENYFQNCSFSPDGLCVMSNSVLDNRLRLYNTLSSSSDQGIQCWSAPDLQVQLCGAVRDYVWYPKMDSNDPATCCFLAASRDQPVQLIDAYSGQIRANYRPINALDEMEAPTTLLFSESQHCFYCAGFRSDRFIHCFNINNPGRDSTILRLGKTRRSRDGQKGLVSAMAESSASSGGNLLAVGTYSPGSIYLYDVRTKMETNSIVPGKCLIGHGGKWLRKQLNESRQDSLSWLSSAKTKWFQTKTQSGVTQLQFSETEPLKLYSTSRRSNAVLAWDLRMMRGCASYETVTGESNQRIGFDLDESSNKLLVGGIDGQARVYNTKTNELEHQIVVDDKRELVMNGISWTSVDGQAYVAISSGSRQFPSFDNMESDESTTKAKSGCLFMYRVNYLSNLTKRNDHGAAESPSSTSSITPTTENADVNLS